MTALMSGMPMSSRCRSTGTPPGEFEIFFEPKLREMKETLDETACVKRENLMGSKTGASFPDETRL